MQIRQVQSYLFFNGRTDEALAFYQKALGAKVEGLMRFKENPQPAANPPGADEKVMHCAFSMVADRFGVSWMVMAAPKG